MKSNRAIERLLVSLSLAVSAIVGGQLSLRAETTQPVPDTSTLRTTETPVRLSLQVKPSDAEPPLSLSRDTRIALASTASLAAALEPAIQSAQSTQQSSNRAERVPLAAPVQTSDVQISGSQASPSQVGANQASAALSPIDATVTAAAIPVPGTVSTSVAALHAEAAPPTIAELQALAQPEPSIIAQTDLAQTDITPGRATRSGSSYVGLGANIGAIGRTPLGDTSGAILSKIGLTRNISVRPAILINGDATFLFPITLDFPIENAGRVSFAPYVGVGASFSTGDRKNADLIVSGGVDIPLSPQFTLTAGANAGLINGVELGVLIGIGYNFAGF